MFMPLYYNTSTTFNFFIPLLWRQIQLSLEFSNVIKKCHQELNFIPQHLLPVPPCWRNKVWEVVVVRSCTYFLVPVLHAGYLRYCTALNQFDQFVKDRVRLLECSPASCLAPQNHCEEKHKKFITRRIINKSPSHFSFDTGTLSNLRSQWEHNFSFGWMKNSFSWGKTSSFERNTILSHLPGTLKVFWWLIYPFLFNNITLFISRSGAKCVITGKLALFAENRDLLGL